MVKFVFSVFLWEGGYKRSREWAGGSIIFRVRGPETLFPPE